MEHDQLQGIMNFEEFQKDVRNRSYHDYRRQYETLYLLSFLLFFSPEVSKTERDFLELNNFFVRDGWFRVLSFKPEIDAEEKPEQASLVDWVNYRNYCLEQMVERHIHSFVSTFSALFAGRLITIVSLMRGETSSQVTAINAQLDDGIQTIKDTCKQAFHMDVACYSSSFCSSLSMLSMAFTQMLDEENASRFLNNPVHNDSFDSGLDLHARWETMGGLQRLAHRLLEQAKAQDLTGFQTVFSQIMDTALYAKEQNMIALHYRVIHVLQSVFQLLSQEGDVQLTAKEEEAMAVEILTGVNETGVREAAYRYAMRLYERFGLPRSGDRLAKYESVQTYIAEHLQDPKLNLNAVAAHFGYNEKALSAGFKERYGVSITERIQRGRLALAQEAVKQPGISLQEVADISGFGSVNTMYRAFRKYLNTTPGMLRPKATEE